MTQVRVCIMGSLVAGAACRGRGENAIIVVPGARYALTPEEVDRARDLIAKAASSLPNSSFPFPSSNTVSVSSIPSASQPSSTPAPAR